MAEIGGRDGENLCSECEAMEDRRQLRNQRARENKRERSAVLRDLGLVQVRGALGGLYWE